MPNVQHSPALDWTGVPAAYTPQSPVVKHTLASTQTGKRKSQGSPAANQNLNLILRGRAATATSPPPQSHPNNTSFPFHHQPFCLEIYMGRCQKSYSSKKRSPKLPNSLPLLYGMCVVATTVMGHHQGSLTNYCCCNASISL